MSRTILYEDASDGRTADGPASKIAKYVPAEMVTIAMLFFASFSVSGTALWVFVAIGAGLNVLYLMSVSRGDTVTPNPKWYFYLLSSVAFVLWSLATIDAVAKEAGLSGSTSDGQRAFVLALAAFSMPLLDTLLGSRRKTSSEVRASSTA